MRWPTRVTLSLPKYSARGWIGAATYALVLIVLTMLWTDKKLLEDEFFKYLAIQIITVGWLGTIVAAFYSANHGGNKSVQIDEAEKVSIQPKETKDE